MAEDCALFLLVCSDFVVSDLEAVWSGSSAASQRQWSMNVMSTALVESRRPYCCMADDRIGLQQPPPPLPPPIYVMYFTMEKNTCCL